MIGLEKKKSHLVLETEVVSVNGHEDRSCIQTESVWHRQGDMLIVSYQEIMDGQKTVSELQVALDGTRIRLKRAGSIEQDHVFLVGQKTKSQYQTLYGTMDFNTDTESIEICYEQGILKQVTFVYQLFLCEERIGCFKITHQFFPTILSNGTEVFH